MPNMEYTFTSAGNYNLSGSKIEGGYGSLETEANPGQFFNEDYASDTGFTYNSALAEFASGLVRQKSQLPNLGALGVTYTSSVNASWNVAGSTNGTTVGSPIRSGGKLVCSGAQGVKYVLASRNDGNGCLRFKYTPDFNNAPASNIDLVGIGPDDGTTNGRVFLRYDSTGQLKVTVYDTNGSVVYFATAFGVWSPTSGTTYEIELNWDYSTGDIRLYIGGSLFGTIDSAGAWTHTGAADMTVFVGGNPRQLNNTSGSFDDVIFFDAVKHVGTGYVAGYTVPETIYPEVAVNKLYEYSDLDIIQSLDGFTATESGNPGWVIDGKYYNGSSWVTSNLSHAQSNTAAEVNANVSSLSLSDPTEFDVDIVFPASNTLNSVSNSSLEYSGSVYQVSAYIEPISALSVQEFLAYSQTVINTANTSVGIVFKIDGELKYISGGAVVDSDGISISQSNTESEINDNLSILNDYIDGNKSVYPRWILSTTDNTETPLLDTSVVSFDFGGVKTNPDLCLVYGHVTKIDGSPKANVKIKISIDDKVNQYSEAAGNIVDPEVEVITNENGYFETNLIKSSAYESSRNYKLVVVTGNKYVDKNNNADITFTVPDVDELNITSEISQA